MLLFYHIIYQVLDRQIDCCFHPVLWYFPFSLLFSGHYQPSPADISELRNPNLPPKPRHVLGENNQRKAQTDPSLLPTVYYYNILRIRTPIFRTPKNPIFPGTVIPESAGLVLVNTTCIHPPTNQQQHRPQRYMYVYSYILRSLRQSIIYY